MTMRPASVAALLSLATFSLAQGFGSFGAGGGGEYNGGDSSSNGNPQSAGGDSGSGFSIAGFSFSHYTTVITLHAVLGTVAFGFIFPVGGILIRLASFRGAWLVHGIIQMFGYMAYIGAFALGIYMISHRPLLLHASAHPIIGIVLLGLLFLQPIFGSLHHALFKKYNRRVFWSYAHIWLGRIIITLGIVNGGLGLRLARRFPLAPPSHAVVLAYGIGAGVMWLLYVMSIVIGERRRRGAALKNKKKRASLRVHRESRRYSGKREYAW